MTAYEDAVLADAPLIYYKLDDANGVLPVDSSGNSRTATYGDGVQTAGIVIGSVYSRQPQPYGYPWGYDAAPMSVSALTLETWIDAPAASITSPMAAAFAADYTANVGALLEVYGQARDTASGPLVTFTENWPDTAFTQWDTTTSTSGAWASYAVASGILTITATTADNGYTHFIPATPLPFWVDGAELIWKVESLGANAAVSMVPQQGGIPQVDVRGNTADVRIESDEAEGPTIVAIDSGKPWYRVAKASGIVTVERAAASTGPWESLYSRDPVNPMVRQGGVDGGPRPFRFVTHIAPASMGQQIKIGPVTYSSYEGLTFDHRVRARYGNWTTGWSGATTVEAAANLSGGAAHHLALTFNGTQVELFVDGASAGASAATGAMNIEDAYSTVNHATNLPRLDEAAVYGTALSSARVLAHYNAGRTPSDPVRTVEVLRRVDARPDQTWTLLLEAKSSIDIDLCPLLQLYSGNVQIGTTSTAADQYTHLTTVWQQIRLTYTIPSDGSVTGIRAALSISRLDFETAGAVPDGSQIQFRNIALEQVVPDRARYFDGSTLSATADYLWEGEAHNSRSHYYGNRTLKTARLRALLPKFLPLGIELDVLLAQPDTIGYGFRWAVENYNNATGDIALGDGTASLTLEWTFQRGWLDIPGEYPTWGDLASLGGTWDEVSQGVPPAAWTDVSTAYATWSALLGAETSWADVKSGP